MNNQKIKIELFGIPRLRAGVAEFFVPVKSFPCQLCEVFSELDRMMPELGQELFENGELRSAFIANVSGNRFARSPDQKVEATDTVLIMSSDAGG